MLDYDPKINLQHYPLAGMAKYGLNPYNEPLYRIVFKDSVRHLVGKMWPDGEIGYRWVPKYRGVKAPWILERWSYVEMSQREWDRLVDPLSGYLILGPYPSRGEYNLAWEFDKGVANDSLDKIIATIEHGRKRSFQDCRDNVERDYSYEDKATKQEIYDEYRNDVRFRPLAALSYGKYGRGTKTMPDFPIAERHGLPVPKKQPRKPADLRGLDLTSTLSVA